LGYRQARTRTSSRTCADDDLAERLAGAERSSSAERSPGVALKHVA
jgi:hypothetical protein